MRLLGVLAGAVVLTGVVVAKTPSLSTSPHVAIQETAERLFGDMPVLDYRFDLVGQCGADETVNPRMAYCTSGNTILYRQETAGHPWPAYELAHLYGHAVQVRHGVADIALREIRARPAEEAKLRGWVTRQVECIAGVITAEAGLPRFVLADHYDAEPMTGSHWGRNPLSRGPKVSIGMAARQEWFDIGYRQGLAACAPGAFGSELLLKARR